VLRTPSQSLYDQDLYVREADGIMVKIGPLIPPSASVGPPAGGYQEFIYGPEEVLNADASADLSHVVFSVATNAPLWPGDTTLNKQSGASLYEYAGTGNGEPELVGVSGGRGSESVISPCTYLGAPPGRDGDIYNAVSSEGGLVYFTAEAGNKCLPPEGPEVTQVYARLDGLQTVAISEPKGSQCSACQTGTPAPASFAGASEDGSQAFFLTEQELLPGAKGMNLYEYDFDDPVGQKIVRVSTGSSEPEVQGVARISEDGSHAYFVAKGVLTKEPRGGNTKVNAKGETEEGTCLKELSSTEKLEEQTAQEEEEKSLVPQHPAKCRPKKGADNMYVFERDSEYPAGKVSFIATLSESDGGDWGADDERPVQATPDGRFLVFQSAAALTAGDKGGVPQVFEYSAESGEMVRVSTGQHGYAAGVESADENGSGIGSQGYGRATGRFGRTGRRAWRYLVMVRRWCLVAPVR
jgi:hypothetical protein